MKVGDFVRKTQGDSDVGMTGIIVEVITNDLGNTVITVSCDKGIRRWYSRFVEVINETA